MHPVYTRSSSSRLRISKRVGHGLSAHRPQSAGYDPGTTPPRAKSAPSGLAQKRDNETHRPVKSRLRRDMTDRGPHQRCGAGEKPAGKRLASEKRHRADTDQEAKGLPPQVGGKERGRILPDAKIAGSVRVAVAFPATKTNTLIGNTAEVRNSDVRRSKNVRKAQAPKSPVRGSAKFDSRALGAAAVA